MRRAPSMLARQLAHRVVEAGEGQRIHAVVHQLLDHLDRLGVAPMRLGHRVQPHRGGIDVGHPLYPHRASFLVEMLDAAARMADLIGAHRRVADERSEEHTSELQSLMRISYAVFCLKKKKAK